MVTVLLPHCLHISGGSSTIHPAYSRQATGCDNTSTRNWGTLQLLYLKGTQACQRAGQRAEAAESIKSQTVMAWTG
jgi:hypothetical protein